MAERIMHLPPILERIGGATKAVFVKPNHPISVSDRISFAGLALMFPDFIKNNKLAKTVLLFIAIGTTVDDFADEGLDFDSINIGMTNAQRYLELTTLVKNELTPLHDSELESQISEWFADVWKIETYAHTQNLNETQQVEYRELINATWTIAYATFVKELLANSKKFKDNQNEEDDSIFKFPSITDFYEIVVNANEYQQLLNKYAYLINGEEGVDTLEQILFLLVMETSNWYDTLHNLNTNKKTTPRIRQFTRKYNKRLKELGIPSWTTDSIFLAMSIVILSLRLANNLKNLNIKISGSIKAIN